MIMKLFTSSVHREESGVTIVEILVAMAVTGILAVALVQVIRQTSEAIESNRKISKMLGNLRSAGQRMTNKIRTVGRTARNSRQEYRLIGFNPDGRFEDSDTSTGRPLGSPSDGDHLHFHAQFPDPPTGETPAAGDTHVVGFFLNDGTHQYLTDQDGDGINEWGLLSRDTYVTGASIDISNPASTISNLTGAVPIGYNVDYLSFRYYDAGDTTAGGSRGSWFQSWDSHDFSRLYINGVDKEKVPEYPDAIEIAIRGYDPRRVAGSDPERALNPRWYYVTIGFNRHHKNKIR